MTAWAFALVYLGLTALSHTTEHYRAASAEAAERAALRAAGGTCLLLALCLCAAVWSWPTAPIAWLGMLTAAGLALVVLLPYSRRAAGALAMAAPIAALVWETIT